MFVGRSWELSALLRALEKGPPQFVRVLGRRRVGKTELLLHFLEGRKALLFDVDETTTPVMLGTLAAQFATQVRTDPPFLRTWDDFLDAVERSGLPLIVFDEFQHVLESGGGGEGRLRSRWDRRWRKSGPSVILCGSSIGMMRGLAEARGAPLYGRLTADLRLRPMEYRDVRAFHPDLSEAERVRRFAVFGGTPYYQAMSLKGTLEESISRALLNPESPLLNEPTLLLRSEYGDPTRYNSVLTAVGEGCHALHDIESRLGTPHGGLGSYLRSLQEDMDLISLEVPLLGRSKLGRYVISDPFFAFYYRFIPKERPLIEARKGDDVLSRIRPQLEERAGRVFERVALEALVRAPEIGGRSPRLRAWGRWWNRTGEEIDIVLVGEDRVWAGEVKWSSAPQGTSLVYDLLRKIPLIEGRGQLTVLPFVVSRGGVTDGAAHLLEERGGFALTLEDLTGLFEGLERAPLHGS
ncbi:MAG: ATP-binding protein [Euryarchaeota archaeon]|nr:ATP-binding protein [Euryarchaeota archaeon]MDE1836138.1 ATP-binding protein [Euryarchaeota archaeon]MDE1879428.1 ATP-binding protein [Euryarchaeota archaeon]MDE2044116.1 ATP-binding protein [Thermoplasmata archaeon]